MNLKEIEKINNSSELLQELIIQVEKDFVMAGVNLNFNKNSFSTQQFVVHISKRLEELHKETPQKMYNLFYRIDLPLPQHNNFNFLAETLVIKEFLKVWGRKNHTF